MKDKHLNETGFLDSIEALIHSTYEDAWDVYKGHLNGVGFDTLLYAYVDTVNYEVEEAPFLYKSTVSEKWFEHYYKEDYHKLDHVMLMRKRGNTSPITLGSHMDAPEEFRDKKTTDMIQESGEAGFKSSINFQLNDPIKRSPDDIFAMTISTSGSPQELQGLLQRHGREIDILTQLVHSKLSYSIVRSTLTTLTPRELECLNWAAHGLRTDRISEKLGITNNTVNFHLKNTKQKLNAKTLSEAVAIAFRVRLFDV